MKGEHSNHHKSFEDVQCWQKSKDFTVNIYDTFRNSKDFGFRDQIQLASVSVMNNIAEDFERNSDREFQQYLYIAKGSCGEVRSMLHLAKELQYISKAQFEKLQYQAEEISKMLSGFIKAFKL